MDIVCEHCKSKFKVPDEKFPPGKVASFPCPKCKQKITVGAVKKPDPPDSEPQAASSPADAALTEDYDASDKPFDFVEEESKTALVCEPDPAVKKTLIAALEQLEYHITDAADTAEALKKMRYHVYDVVFIDESFDTDNPDSNEVVAYLERVNMAVRRNIFVVLISQRYRTMDNMMAFHKSVNMVINVKNIGDIQKILGKGITDNDFFYNVFMETLRKIGKA